ncbi:unnamed protein product [Mytilus coruscus]|uniref:Uncharacterized protein n=1 Tax=Mytilus coruscus TaxID=42192 RepID=A0A6J8AQ65_MYTCO|nr:unnamed protein product [Mytilus coruscus]
MANHRSIIELMTYNFLSENNGFWITNYPDTYAKVISQSTENSQKDMKARIEVLEFINRVGNSNNAGRLDTWLEMPQRNGIKTPDELFPGKQQPTTSPSPLSPSTSGILLDDDSEENEEQEENKKVTNPEKNKKTDIEGQRYCFFRVLINF